MDSRKAITPNETSMDIRSMTTNDQRAATLDSAKCSAENLPLFIQHINSCGYLLRWLGNEGKAFLEREWLSQEEWEALVKQCFLALTEMPQTKSLKLIYQLAIRKGIASLLNYSKSDIMFAHDAEKYFISLAHELTPNRFGIGSHLCSVEESRSMIDSLIPIAQTWKSDDMLDTIGGCRFPGRDKAARVMFIKANKNW